MAPDRKLAYLALGLICIIWGTTYTAIKVAVEFFPPYLLVGIRQTGAGVLILLMAWLTGALAKARPYLTGSYLGKQVLAGVIMITGGNGLVTFGMQYVSSGIAAVIGALVPVMVLLINMVWYRKGERTSAYTISGVLLGFAGLGFVFHHGWADFTNPDYRWGILGCFGSCFTWSMGTVIAKRINKSDVKPIVNAGFQILAGGLGGFVMSLFFDQNHTIQHTCAGWGATIYLIVIGSALAFSLYMFVLSQMSAAAASIYTYINPAVAVFLGWLLLHEPLHVFQVVGMCITLCGVWLVNKGE
jgi:drug/metabolite transporter (DMT)-like permease